MMNMTSVSFSLSNVAFYVLPYSRRKVCRVTFQESLLSRLCRLSLDLK